MKTQMIHNVDWRVMIPSVMAAAGLPYIDLLARFMIPIASGIAWVFLKPHVEKLRNNFKNRKNEKTD